MFSPFWSRTLRSRPGRRRGPRARPRCRRRTPRGRRPPRRAAWMLAGDDQLVGGLDGLAGAGGPTWTTSCRRPRGRAGRPRSRPASPPTMIDSAASFAPCLAAGDRGVEEPDAPLRGRLGELDGDVRADAGEVDDEGAGLGVGEDAVLAGEDLLRRRASRAPSTADDVGVGTASAIERRPRPPPATSSATLSGVRLKPTTCSRP